MKRNILAYAFGLFFLHQASAQRTEIYPPYWFTGMQQDTLQLIIKTASAATATLSVEPNHSHIRLIRYTPSEHPDYALAELVISKQAAPGYVPLKLSWGKNERTLRFELKARNAYSKQPLTQSDHIYLIMPDRFANAHIANDSFKGLNEKQSNRHISDARHGGDLDGIRQHMDYIKQTGATAIWLTPFQENNEPIQSYHGYAITNHYQTDIRLGSNADYTALVQEAHGKGVKVVMDFVFNHIGDQHWMYRDMPFPRFIHQQDSFQRTNYRANTLLDPYASEADKKRFTEGWFDRHMPDLNAEDADLTRYLVQNTLWWLETSGADAIRIDTYTYPEQNFMEKWYKQIRKQYPHISIFGEIWEHAVPLQSYFAPKHESKEYAMQQVLDFQFCFAVNKLLNEQSGWTEGVARLYYVLSQDFLYANAYEHIIFLDNHDLDRFFAQVNGELEKFKAGIGFLFTMRGIPCTFYGTEVLMQGKGPHGIIREDMQGGWPGDSADYFKSTGLTSIQREGLTYIKKLAKWRQSAIGPQSKLMQFVPEDGVYVYFRYGDGKKIMVVYNSSAQAKDIQLARFNEMLQGAMYKTDVLSGARSALDKTLLAKPGMFLIFEID